MEIPLMFLETATPEEADGTGSFGYGLENAVLV